MDYRLCRVRRPPRTVQDQVEACCTVEPVHNLHQRFYVLHRDGHKAWIESPTWLRPLRRVQDDVSTSVRMQLAEVAPANEIQCDQPAGDLLTLHL